MSHGSLVYMKIYKNTRLNFFIMHCLVGNAEKDFRETIAFMKIVAGRVYTFLQQPNAQ